jgi:hypothetical protein
MLADVLHHARNLVTLDHRFVNSLAQLLNQFAQTRRHGYLPEAAADVSFNATASA